MNRTTSGVTVLERISAQQESPPESRPQLTPPTKSDFFTWLARSWPTMLVLAALAGVAYWGHHTGWAIPKFSDLMGNGQSVNGDWCNEHSVPESICVECNDKLMPKDKVDTWCRKHGVHNCPFERPEVAQLKAVPPIKKADLDRAQRALDLKERQENNPKCKLHHRRLQFMSKEVMDKMGIDVAPVWEGPIVETINVSGEITFEQPRVAPLFVPVSGRVVEVSEKGRIGVHVKKGDVLAMVDAADVGKAKAEFLQALAQLDLKSKNVEVLKPLASQGIVADVRFREAQAALREAEIRLVAAQQALINMGLPVRLEEVKDLSPEELGQRTQFLGLPPEITRTLDPRTTTANLLPVKASRDGTVIAAKVVPGEMVDPSKTLFMVADTSQMWLMLNVRNEDAKYLRARDAAKGMPGQKVLFRPDGSNEEIVTELVWTSKAIDEKTRTIPARADLPNPDGKLLASTFGTGRIVLREEKSTVVVPSEAVHWEGDCHVVFVRDKNFFDKGAQKVFHVRTVRPGVKNGADTEIIAGLLPGEVVATRNSAALRAELMKGKLGEG